MNNPVPALYIKKHKGTGLKYFGRTTQEVYSYPGSGTYWKNHCNKYGWDIETTDVFYFETQEECTEFALKFSKDNNIVESKDWANMMEEDGLIGFAAGPRSSVTRSKISFSKKGKKPNPESVEKGRQTQIKNWQAKSLEEKKAHAELGRINGSKPKPDSHGLNISKALKGREMNEEWRKKTGLASKDTKFINNGMKNKKVKSNLLAEYLNKGWKLGLIKKEKEIEISY